MRKKKPLRARGGESRACISQDSTCLVSQDSTCLVSQHSTCLACQEHRKCITLGTNGVPMARHGLILSQDGATSLRNLFKYLPAAVIPLKKCKMRHRHDQRVSLDMCSIVITDMCFLERPGMCCLERPDMCCLGRPDMCCLG